MDNLLLAVVVFGIAYLLGSIPTAYIIGRLQGVDIFSVGSGNMGATNMIRATGKVWQGAVVWFLDSAKSVAAVLIGMRLMWDAPALATVITSVAAMIGHNWSVLVLFITGKLRGGKGAAAAFGTMLIVAPFQVIIGMLLAFLVILTTTRFVSLGVLVMFGFGVGWVGVLIAQGIVPPEYIIYLLAVYALLLYRFRENIRQLIAGTERRFGDHRKQQ
jgi:glycerol-3-phosphate acyltransferase PlsY